MSINIDNLVFNIKLFEAKRGYKPNFLVMNHDTHKILDALATWVVYIGDLERKYNPYDSIFYGVRIAINDSLDDYEIEIV